MSAHLGLILHVQAGDNSPFGWFSDPAHNASSTWWVSKSGVIEQYVDADTVAWAQAAGNGVYNSVETEGEPGESLTPAQIKALARLYAWGHKTYGWLTLLAEVPGQRGFGWHGMGGSAWGGHSACPGSSRRAQRQEILNAAGLLINPVPAPPAIKHPAVGICASSDKGYYVVASDGGIFALGQAAFFGSMGGVPLEAPVVGMDITPTGNGYILAGADGGVFCFGDAVFCGSMGGKPLDAAITGIEITPSGKGYWLIGADGGVFAFGDALFVNSAKQWVS